jgi:CheY-like chemotaxis protein
MDLNRLVRYAAGMLRPVVGENIELAVRLSPTLGGIHADPPRVEQIVMNLVLNARDAMPQGGLVEVETSTVELHANSPVWQPEAEAPPPGRYAVLSVRDTGHGMDPDTLKHIWEPFFTTKPAGQGTGLGLSVVYGSVKQSGGFVWAESEAGRGTTIRVYWPETLAVSEHTGEIPIPSPVQQGTENVLVVEDEPVVRALIVRTVMGFGYRCLEAHDATEALRLLEQEQGKFDLVITDVVMPGMSGGRLGELLAHHYPALPVLYTSGFANNDIIRRGLLDASRPFLQKPFTPDDLARKIRDVLEASTASDYEPMPRKQPRPRKHSVKATLKVHELSKAGTSLHLEIYREGEKLGALEVGRGALYWAGGKRKSNKRIDWSRFAELMDELTYGN